MKISNEKIENIKEKMKEKKIKQNQIEDIIDEMEDMEENEYADFVEKVLKIDFEIDEDEDENTSNVEILEDLSEEDMEIEDNKIGSNLKYTEDNYSEDIVKQYFLEISRYRQLTPKIEKELIKRAKTGDEKAKEILITSNLRLVAKLALKYAKSGVFYLDLVQDGTIGLMKAIEKFDETKGYRLSTYSTWWIKKEIIDSLKEKINFIKIPNYIFLNYQKIVAAEKELINKKGTNYTIEEVSKLTEMSEEEILNIKSIIDSNKIKSNDDEKAMEVEDNRMLEDIEREINSISQKVKVSNMLKKLNKVERDVIEMYFGLAEEMDRQNYKEISEKLNLSPERVRLIAKRALKKLRFIGAKKWRNQ